jgi:hypothetical protein
LRLGVPSRCRRPRRRGPLLVVTADGKGCRCGARRRTAPGPIIAAPRAKADKKRMACVGTVYSIERFVRRAEDVLDEVLRDERARRRPRPQHKRVWVEMTRQVGGIEVPAKERLFCELYTELTTRPGARPPGGLPAGHPSTR